MIMMIIYRYNKSHPINFSIKTHAEELCTQTWRSIYIAAFIFTYVSSHRSRPRLIQPLKQNYGNFANIQDQLYDGLNTSQYHLPSQEKTWSRITKATFIKEPCHTDYLIILQFVALCKRSSSFHESSGKLPDSTEHCPMGNNNTQRLQFSSQFARKSRPIRICPPKSMP